MDITKNQSYLSNVLDIIIKNILDEKLQAINKILESLYLKQELINELMPFLSEKTGRVPIILPVIMNIKNSPIK